MKMTKTVNVYYAKDMAMSRKLAYEVEERISVTGSETPVACSEKIFKVAYSHLIDLGWVVEDEENSVLNDTFHYMNTGFLEEDRREMIKSRDLNHTSMSVGDIVKMDEELFIVLPMGWGKLKLW
jgi:hypothetical protein